MKKLIHKKYSGFTLLELVVVVAVMGMISTMAMEVYTNNSNQQRYDLTKQRLAEIKFAIIGDPMMRVGSQAVLSGFFNDMKRLPYTLSELIYQCRTNLNVGIPANKDNCDLALGEIWEEKWDGPYLNNIQSNGNDLVFRDAWGNNSDDGNFGWNYAGSAEPVPPTLPTDHLWIQSLGLDRILTTITSDTNKYEIDRPSPNNHLINKFELINFKKMIGLASQSVFIPMVNKKTDTIAAYFCLSIKTESGSPSKVYYSENHPVNLEQNYAKLINFSKFSESDIPLTNAIPNGNYIYEIYKIELTTTDCKDKEPSNTNPNTLFIKQNGFFATLKIFN
ncbi:MAG: prepilin-type N-terminal cleavage/methylation domain-containing protein [Gammaproteobacteria bacterium]|nr:prepilin-type N-terminal cleavage/methylation domain-containing protein [Gammaproteobacteria bacterium]